MVRALRPVLTRQRRVPLLAGREAISRMVSAYYLVIACGVLALLYGFVTSRQVLSANAGTARMQEISGAVQLGARAYLNRQYRAVAIVGVVILVILWAALGLR